jgi:DNA-binding response OmpR family regulator
MSADPHVPVESSTVATRILVVEDEPTISEFLRVGLSYEGYEVCVVDDGRRALALVKEQSFDLLILDLMLPGADGFEICRRLRSWGNDVPVIMLTARGKISDRIAGLDLGADDYVTKPFSFEELVARVRAVLRRRGHPNELAELRIGELVLLPESHEAYCGAKRLELTPREFALLELLMRHPRRVFTRETLINRVWGINFVGDTNVVDVHMSHLRRKIGREARRLIQTVHGVGYCLRPDDGDAQ